MSALDLSLGCILIGVILNLWLYGFSCVQFYLYYANFKADRSLLRYFVSFLFLVDTMNSVFDAHFIYDYLVTHFGDMLYASRSNVTFTTDPVMTAIIAFSCQCFFAWRVRRLTNSWIATGTIFILSLTSLFGAIGSTIGVSIVLEFAKFQSFQVVVIIWLLFAALADMVITGSLIWSLNKSRTGFKTTDDLITRLIRTTLQTGLLTTTFAIIDLILFLASPTTLHLVFNLPLSKLYINSLLSTLNARQAISNVIYAADGNSSGARAISSGGVGGNSASHGMRHSAYQPQTHALNDETLHGLDARVRSSSLLGKFGLPRTAPTGGKDFSAALESGIHIQTIEERFEEKSGLNTLQHATSCTTFAGSQQEKMANRSHSNSLSTSESGSSHGVAAAATVAEHIPEHPFSKRSANNN